jgi:acetylornithine deacetylase/succinyl-diaminopimelate desuccinylase-like protein
MKSNSLPAHSTLVCDVRTLPHQDEAYVRSQVEELLQGIAGVTYELVYTAVPSASPYDTPFAAALRRATAAVTGRADLAWLPSLVTGFTDSRLVRPLGTVVYGFSPAAPDSDMTVPNNIHAANESTEVHSLLFRTKLLIALACDVLGEREE